MSYRVRVAPSAAKELVSYFPETISRACVRFIFDTLSSDPAVGTRLRDPFAGQWCAQRGEYRVRYRVDESAQTLDVLDITHRRDPATRSLLR
jgi:mRNA interferase RelE/StbE